MSGVSVVSYRNSTSNHNCVGWIFGVSVVVSYRNSTSNHNGKSFMDREDKVVSYRNSTSNHNTSVSNAAISSLYLIEILHQTTTNQWRRCNTGSCILSKFYIKPQHWQDEAQIDTRCILSKFYIKPQHIGVECCHLFVVSYRNSTSNHNIPSALLCNCAVVSYRNSTSNHNNPPFFRFGR